MRKYRWAKNYRGGVTLQTARTYSWCGPEAPIRRDLWLSTANVFKAKRGDRWIVELDHGPRHAVHNLREGMRLCKMLVLLEHRNV